jgi:hypothetical protein
LTACYFANNIAGIVLVDYINNAINRSISNYVSRIVFVCGVNYACDLFGKSGKFCRVILISSVNYTVSYGFCGKFCGVIFINSVNIASS